MDAAATLLFDASRLAKWRRTKSTRLSHHGLEISAGDDQSAILCHVEFVEEIIEIGLKRAACLRIDGCERFQDLSDVLKTVRLTGATFFDVVARAPWVAEQPPREAILPRILPGAEHLISYHVVTEGRCYASIIGAEAIELDAGDVVVFTKGDPHVLSSSPGMRADRAAPGVLEAAALSQLPIFINYGDGGAVAAKFVCGFLACDAHPFNPLLDNLPPIIKVADTQGSESSWLGQFIRLATIESADKRAGAQSVLARLSELMFIEVLRRYLDGLPAEQAGWLAGLRDPFVGKALSLMHGSPAHGWTIEELAKEVGLSRSVLAERFADLVGIPPILYLAKWRMQLAAGMLSTGNGNMARIAAESGYESEAAFSRAFKKMTGVPPSIWRRRIRPGSLSQ